MSLGSSLLKISTKYRHGLRVAYYRDWVRQRILKTTLATETTDTTCEIHVLTCEMDWLNLLWALKSFYLYSNKNYSLCIHDDGTLRSEHFEVFQRHFPGARIISRAEADAKVLPILSRYPRCRIFRKSNHLAPKVFDFAVYLTTKRMLLLDSDILFFDSPKALIQKIEDPCCTRNVLNGDVASAYTVKSHDVKSTLGFDLVGRVNSGLGLIHKESLNLGWMEEFLGLPGIIGHFWRIEQTLYALASSKFGVELLPKEYDVYLTNGVGDRPSRHYVGAIRHRMYGEGMAHLQKQGFLKSIKP